MKGMLDAGHCTSPCSIRYPPPGAPLPLPKGVPPFLRAGMDIVRGGGGAPLPPPPPNDGMTMTKFGSPILANSHHFGTLRKKGGKSTFR